MSTDFCTGYHALGKVAWNEELARRGITQPHPTIQLTILLGPASGDDVGDLGGVEELHGELRAEVLVAELGREVVGHVLGRRGAVLGRVQPEPLRLNG